MARTSISWAPAVAMSLVLLTAAPVAQAEPDEGPLGKYQDYPVGTNSGNWYDNRHRVGSWSAMDRVWGLPHRVVPRGTSVTPLPPAPQQAAIRYRFRNRKGRSLSGVSDGNGILLRDERGNTWRGFVF